MKTKKSIIILVRDGQALKSYFWNPLTAKSKKIINNRFSYFLLAVINIFWISDFGLGGDRIPDNRFQAQPSTAVPLLDH